MTTAVLHPRQEGTVRVFLKGAPELVTPLCTNYINKDGEVASLDSQPAVWLDENIIGNFAKNHSLRTLALGYKDMSEYEFNNLKETSNNFETEEGRQALESDMTFVVGFGL